MTPGRLGQSTRTIELFNHLRPAKHQAAGVFSFQEEPLRTRGDYRGGNGIPVQLGGIPSLKGRGILGHQKLQERGTELPGPDTVGCPVWKPFWVYCGLSSQDTPTGGSWDRDVFLYTTSFFIELGSPTHHSQTGGAGHELKK